MLVNGEHRIGVYACTYTLHFIVTKILEGEELFINYGPSFFPTPLNTEEVKVEEPKPTPSSNSIQHVVEDTSDSGSCYFESSDLD